MDEFKWDEVKAAKCFAERKISFQDAASALLGVTVTNASHREGEARFASICECNGVIPVVVWTVRGNNPADCDRQKGQDR